MAESNHGPSDSDNFPSVENQITDFRALCAQMLAAWERGDDIVGAMNRARAALAEGEAGLSDEEIGEFFQPGANLSLHCESGTDWSELLMDKDEFLVAVRAFLARYSAPRPIPVAERLPSVIESVIAERHKQDQRWGGPAHDDTHSKWDWLEYIQSRMFRLEEDRSAEDQERLLVQIAALAVAAVESLRRQLPAHAIPTPENADG